MVIDVIAPFSRSQHGLVTRDQLRSALTARQIERASERGQLELVVRGVYRVGGAPDGFYPSVLAACLAAGPTARASFACAARLWELDGFSHSSVEITVDRARRARIPGAVVHQSSVTDDTVEVAGVPVASVARTLCDLTAVSRPWIVERAVDECLRRRIVTLADLTKVHTALAGRGRRRCTVMREILAWRAGGLHPGDSAPEVRIVKLLRLAGLPLPIQQYELRAGGRQLRIDLAYPQARLAIEYDGWEFHSTRGAFDRDRARANDLQLLGWTVLRFTSRSTDEVIVGTVRAALARPGDGGPPPMVGKRHLFAGGGPARATG